MTEREYRANHNGLNVVFGAALGFVLASAESLAPLSYLIVLIVSAGIVVTILYISASADKWIYAGLAAVMIALLPRILGTLDSPLPSKLQPTLAIWALIVAMLELVPRRPSD